MKNVIKKVSAFALAFTLLGSGATITKNIPSTYNNTIVAYADQLVTKNFVDVSESDWYFYAVDYVSIRGYMNGTSNNRFSPSQLMTRAQFVTVLYNITGRPYIEYTNKFTDVPNSQWYTSPVMWAYKNGITSGISNTLFGTDSEITREQLVKMLYSYDKTQKHLFNNVSSTALNSFTDKNQVSDWALEAMRWAVTNDIINGTGVDGKYLDPQGKADRAQCAQIIKNYLDDRGHTDFKPLQQKNYNISICQCGRSNCNKTIASSGCGLMATVNAVGFLTGKTMDINEVANTVKKKKAYIHDVGCIHEVAKVLAEEIGTKYGIKCVGYKTFSNTPGKNEFDEVWKGMIGHLQQNHVAVTLVNHHFIAIVDYDKKTEKVLVYDSAASSNRGTTINGDWKSYSELRYNSGTGKADLKLRSAITYLARN